MYVVSQYCFDILHTHTHMVLALQCKVTQEPTTSLRIWNACTSRLKLFNELSIAKVHQVHRIGQLYLAALPLLKSYERGAGVLPAFGEIGREGSG